MYPIPSEPVFGQDFDPVDNIILFPMNVPLFVFILNTSFSLVIFWTSVSVIISTSCISASLIKDVWILVAWLEYG